MLAALHSRPDALLVHGYRPRRYCNATCASAQGANCTFERLDGNGVMVSGYNRNTSILDSDFAFLGGNAIAAWGYTNETTTDPGLAPP